MERKRCTQFFLQLHMCIFTLPFIFLVRLILVALQEAKESDHQNGLDEINVAAVWVAAATFIFLISKGEITKGQLMSRKQ